MNDKNSVTRIVECMERAGIVLPDQVDINNINLNDYILDSVSFVSFIMAIEDEFNIEVPDEMLLQSSLTTLKEFNNMLIKHLENQK